MMSAVVTTERGLQLVGHGKMEQTFILGFCFPLEVLLAKKRYLIKSY